jgi:conjugative transfer pilus assembly protein TraH
MKDQSILKAIMDGGSATIYACDNTAVNKCLNVSNGPISIDPNDALNARVNAMLQDIENKYTNDQPLTPEEKGFLNSTDIPVLKFIQVSLESGNRINTQNYAQMISQDLLCKYLEGIIDLIRQSLSYSSHFGSSQRKIMNGLARANISVANMKSNIYTKIQAQTALIKQSIQYQKMIMGSLSSRFETGSTG